MAKSLLTANIYESADPKIRIHRRSHISSFALCPSKLAAEDRWETGGGEGLEVARRRGRLFHRCAQYVLLAQQKGWKPGKVDVEPVIAQEEHPLITPEVKDEIRELVNNWIADFPFRREDIGETETQYASTILTPDESPDGLTHKIGGQMDLRIRPKHIWDWKTSWRCMTQSQAEEDIQVGSYALLASDAFGLDSVTVSLCFVRWGVARTVEFDLDAIAAWEQRLKNHLIAFLKWEKAMGEADPNEKRPGPHCAWCPILTRCDSAAPDAIKGVEDASTFGNHLERIKHQSPAMKAALVAWLQRNPNETVVIGDRRYKLGLQGSNKVEDAEALAAICQAQGIDFWGCLSVDKAKLERLCKKNPGLLAEVEALVVDRRKPALVPAKD